jgi:carboxyl-terminal processing protease
MTSKSLRILLVVLISIFVIAGSFTGGFIAGWTVPRTVGAPPALELLSNGSTSTPVPGTPEDMETLFEPFWQAWDLVKTQYVDQPVDQELLMRGAIRGMLNSLGDQHTGYMDPVEFEQANAPLDGEYEGIGAWVDTTGEFLTIISPMEGSPAEAAGVQSGDKIVAVDGEDVTGQDPSLVLRKVLGPKGTTVQLTLIREGMDEPIEVSIVRQKIAVPTLEAEMLDNNIAYVQIYNFGEKTDTELRAKLRELLRNYPIGIILDLRNNPGGYLDTAIKIVSEFIKDGVVMYEEYGDGTRTTFDARGNGLATNIPLVVLINQGSASASEITAGAIQDRERGLLVGAKSFGKGTVQSWTPLVDEQGAVKITIARWLTPSERQITGVGLTPDVEVLFTEEDALAERDPQLDKAIELLLRPDSWEEVLSN